MRGGPPVAPGTSSYQAAWILDDEEYGTEDEEDEVWGGGFTHVCDLGLDQTAHVGCRPSKRFPSKRRPSKRQASYVPRWPWRASACLVAIHHPTCHQPTHTHTHACCAPAPKPTGTCPQDEQAPEPGGADAAMGDGDEAPELAAIPDDDDAGGLGLGATWGHMGGGDTLAFTRAV